jgi:F0F1-type ATP synthase delta subunit
MKEPALFDEVIVRLRTTSDVSLVFACLEEFVNTFFSSKQLSEQQQIFRKLPKEIADMLIQAFASEPITLVNQISTKRKIDDFTDKLRKVKTLQLTIAFRCNEDTITLFSDWVKKNIKKDLIIDLHYDKTIVGGAVLIADGSYKDYSVKKNLSNRFQIQKDEIYGLLE